MPPFETTDANSSSNKERPLRLLEDEVKNIHDCGRMLRSREKAPGRCVRFSDFTETKETLCVDDYTDDELWDSFYCRWEFQKMFSDASKMVNKNKNRKQRFFKIRRSSSHGNLGQKQKQNDRFDEDRLRGLERLTEIGKSETTTRVRMSLNAVLRKQEEQRQLTAKGSDHAESLAAVYIMSSTESKRIALEKGTKDHEIVQNLLQQEMSSPSKTRGKRILPCLRKTPSFMSLAKP